MKSFRTIIISSVVVSAVMAVSSCNTRKEQAVYQMDHQGIKFSLELPDGDSFQADDVANIRCASGTLPYVCAGDSWKPSGSSYFRWSERTGELSFEAVYPADPMITFSQFSLPKNQSKPEFLAAANYARGKVDNPVHSANGILSIKMERPMAKVRIVVAGLSSEDRIQAMKIGSFSGLTDFDKVDEKPAEVIPFCTVPQGGLKGGNGSVFEAFVVPGAASNSINLLSFSHSGAAFKQIGIPERVAGFTYEYTLNVSAGGFELVGPTIY